ncbi:MAG: hypothetical protein AAGI03_01810 [Pseudomonadota bacterium]
MSKIYNWNFTDQFGVCQDLLNKVINRLEIFESQVGFDAPIGDFMIISQTLVDLEQASALAAKMAELEPAKAENFLGNDQSGNPTTVAALNAKIVECKTAGEAWSAEIGAALDAGNYGAYRGLQVSQSSSLMHNGVEHMVESSAMDVQQLGMYMPAAVADPIRQGAVLSTFLTALKSDGT